MAEKSSFFNAVINNGVPDRTYKAEEFAKYFGSFISNGVFPNPNTNLEVLSLISSFEGMNIKIKPGEAWINGYYYYNNSDLILTVDSADGVLKRIDRVVIRLDFINREITCKVKKGAFASSPVPPTLQRDADIYELGIADILVNNGAIAITQSNITDTRLKDELCGMVNSLIKVDSTILTDKLEKDFYDWLATLDGILEGDVAGNLANEILKVNARIDNLKLQGVNVTLADTSNNFKDKTAEGALKELADKYKSHDTKFDDYIKSWVGTQLQYDQMPSKDATTLYFVIEEE